MRKTMFSVLAVVAAAGAASAQVTISGNLTVGGFQNGTVSGDVTTASVATWSYWTFSANSGDNIDIEVNRLNGDLDPASSVLLGNAAGLAFASLTGGSIFDWSGPGLGAVIASGDDDEAPNLPGPFGDPRYGFLASSTGVYTVAVCSFASVTTGVYPFEIIVRGSSAPAPGALALLGAGGLLISRRRRR